MHAGCVNSGPDGDFAAEEKEMMLEIGAGLGLRPAHIKGLMSEFVNQIKAIAGT